ncbi:MAG: hypothetical protein ACK4SL_01320 [Candidatus Paceibacteria bacterium]
MRNAMKEKWPLPCIDSVPVVVAGHGTDTRMAKAKVVFDIVKAVAPTISVVIGD